MGKEGSNLFKHVEAYMLIQYIVQKLIFFITA